MYNVKSKQTFFVKSQLNNILIDCNPPPRQWRLHKLLTITQLQGPQK
jgi:hypothetical protein